MTSFMALQEASFSTSSASISSIHPCTHDVFLSFRGKDVRQKFISHLYNALDKSGINTYIDDEIERGEEISQALFQAIKGSRISIIVLSKNYAESEWCLNELLEILDCMGTTKQIVLPIFYDVDPSDIRHQKQSFGEAFAKLKDRSKGKAEVQKWETALEELANMSGLELKNYRKESEFIQEITKWVDLRMVNQAPLSVAKYPIGIESRIRHIYWHLSFRRNDIIRIVGIFGTGGIGKTTISKDIYNRISSQFEGSCFLKNVRETSKQAGGLVQLQNTLLSKILGRKIDINDDNIGVTVIRDRLRSKRILLILDDVDELVQLENLVGDRDWFGSGSRIIITTRDQHLLEVFEVDSKYEVMILDDNEALQLFSMHAFKKDEPLEDYVELSKQVTKYAQGLPLALTVLGSDLKGQSIDKWKNALDKYRKIPHGNIQKVLSVSYEGLDDIERDIFLDIAFFFKGEPLANVMKIFDCYGFSPAHGIKRLTDKCLITIEGIEGHYECVWMHDLLQDMGREIVRLESPKEPSKRSRLWFHEDIREVLEESTGPSKIEGILLHLPEGDEEIISLHPKAFLHMKRLRVFINRNAHFSCGPNYLSDKLRVLDWDNYPSPFLPRNFQGKKLIVFRMQHSLIKKLGDGFKPKNLTTMIFQDCKFLKKIPDLSSVSNLKELRVGDCTRLVEVHDSIGYLENISSLSFSRCSKLRILPRSLKLRSLRKLYLTLCSSLRYLPEIDCTMESLTTLCLMGTAIEELPLSIGNLVRLQCLYLRDCKNLIRFPIACIWLPHLEELNIQGCQKLVKKMRDDGLSHLAIESTKMEEEISLREEQLHELAPPTNSSNGSTALQLLNIQSCFQSETNFFPISSLFTMFNYSTSLDRLDLSNTEIVSLPTSIKEFVTLTQLRLVGCDKLEEIPELPPNIRKVNVDGCKSLERFPEVIKILEFNGSHIRSLRLINLFGCDKMHVNIWNDKVQNPLLWKVWKGVYEYDASLFPENQMPEWLSYIHELLKDNEMVKGPNDYVKPRGEEEWAIDIKGPHYLEEINGIALYLIVFFKEVSGWSNVTIGDAKITSNNSNHVCYIEWVKLIYYDSYCNDWYMAYVWVGYSNLQSFKLPVLDNLQVQFDLHCKGTVQFYESFRAKVVYKNERRANRKRKMDEVSKSPLFL